MVVDSSGRKAVKSLPGIVAGRPVPATGLPENMLVLRWAEVAAEVGAFAGQRKCQRVHRALRG